MSLARDGRQELARALLGAFPLTGRFAANRTLFIEGLILKAQGHLPVAAEKYRAALTNDPTLAMVRAELAHTLYLLGDDDGAKRELARLEASAPARQQARDIAAVIDAIDGGKPVAVGTGFDSPADVETKVVGGVAFEIPEATEDGLGFASGMDAAYSDELEDRLAAIVGFGSRALQYDSPSPGACPASVSHRCDEFSVSETAEIRYKTEAGYLGFSTLTASLNAVSGGEEWDEFTDSNASWMLGPRFTMFHAIAPDLALRTDVTLLREDGWRTTAEGTVARTFSNRFTGYVSGGVERFDADMGDDPGYWSFFGAVGVHKELPWQFSTAGQIQAKRRFYDNDNALPDPSASRRDLELGTSVSLWNRGFSLWGYSPAVEYSFSWNGSNIGFFDYTSHVFDLRVTKEF